MFSLFSVPAVLINKFLMCYHIIIYCISYIFLYFNSLLNFFFYFSYTVIPSNQIQLWINSVGLVMAALPDSFWSVLQDRLVEVITCLKLQDWPYRNSPFQLFNFSTTHNSYLDNKFSYTLSIAHAIWHHAGVGHLTTIPKYVFIFFNLIIV